MFHTEDWDVIGAGDCQYTHFQNTLQMRTNMHFGFISKIVCDQSDENIVPFKALVIRLWAADLNSLCNHHHLSVCLSLFWIFSSCHAPRWPQCLSVKPVPTSLGWCKGQRWIQQRSHYGGLKTMPLFSLIAYVHASTKSARLHIIYLHIYVHVKRS